MRANDGIEGDVELQHVLWACYTYWGNEPLPVQERSVCHRWVNNVYKDRFGTGFHQSKLRRLVKLGFLEPEEVSRGGNRRYYKIVEPDRVASLLRQWRLL